MTPQTRQKQTESPLDRTTLTVATLASVLGATVTSAVGSGFLASLIAAAIVPAVTAFLMHPGPHRRRRVGAVLALVMLLRGGREAMAKTRRTSAPARRKRDGGPALSASVAFVVAAVSLTLVELVIGHAALAARQFTLLPDESTTSTAQAHDEVSASPPVLLVPRHRIVEHARTAAGARVTFHATAVDSEGDRVTPRCTPASGSRFPIGDTVVHCTATDRHGLQTGGRFTVTVEAVRVLAKQAKHEHRAPRHEPAQTPEAPRPDQTTEKAAPEEPVVVKPAPVDAVAPRLQLPKRVVREAADRSGTVVQYTAKAVDTHDGRVTVDCEPPSGSRFRPGRTTVRCTAADRAGNVARGRFTVLVRADTAAPRLDLPQDIEREADPDGTVVEYTAKAVDGRDGPVTATCSPPSGSRFPVGSTTVTCAATDRAGNTAHGGFAVVVREAPAPDRVPPVLTLPQDITAEAQDSVGTPVAYQATAVDDRDGPVPVTCTPPSGSPFTLGTTTVRCSASDRAGNAAEASFRVTVTEPPDTEPPELEIPQSVATRTTASTGTQVDYPATAVDRRDGVVPIRCSPRSGATFPIGDTTVRCTARDRAGNVATGTFVVTVTLVAPPGPR